MFILPVVGSLDVPLYARQSPAISGIPFFIWFQFVLVIVGALVTGVVNHLQHRHGEQEEAEAVNP
ncbi:MAG TPA: DUF3311 domain-containing protein [Acidimicrobiales bacterium]|nr:DUF3311 domain-containing protein [Acidimicrobiales bacterium]